MTKSNELLEALHWRYATKQFDPAKKISAADWAALEDALVLSPSSCGLQPWKFLVINDPAVREKLLPASWNQRQVVDCSHFVVFAVNVKTGEAEIDRHLQRTAEVRGVHVESLATFRGMMMGDLVNGPRSAVIGEWAARQAYIALGNLMTSAALLKIDTCPMEGFVPVQYDEILGLAPKGLTAAVCCAVGYRSAEDKYAALPKVRFKKEDVIVQI